MCIKFYHKYYWRVCYQVVFKGFNNPVCLNHFALQQPMVDLKRRNPAGGVVPQKTTSASGDDTSTGLVYISGDKDIPVCMCILCVGVQRNILQRLQTYLPFYIYCIVW